MMLKNGYEEVATLRDDDGIVAIVTRKGGTHHLSFSITKVFERDGKFVNTGFLNKRHIPGVRRLLNQLEEILDRESDRSVAARAKTAATR